MPKPVDDKKMWELFVESAQEQQKREEDAILEAYEAGKITKEQLVEEGLWDRLKARGAGAVGSAKGLGQRVGGMAKGAMAGMRGDTEGVQAAQAQQQSGASMGLNARAISLVQSYSNKITKLVSSLRNDLNKLGLDDSSLKQSNPEVYETIRALKQESGRLGSSVSPEGGEARTGGKVHRTAAQIPGQPQQPDETE